MHGVISAATINSARSEQQLAERPQATEPRRHGGHSPVSRLASARAGLAPTVLILWSGPELEPTLARRISTLVEDLGLACVRADGGEPHTSALVGLSARIVTVLLNPAVLQQAAGRRLLQKIRAVNPPAQTLLLAPAAAVTCDTLIQAIRAGISDVLDPGDPAAVTRAVAAGLRRLSRERVPAIGSRLRPAERPATRIAAAESRRLVEPFAVIRSVDWAQPAPASSRARLTVAGPAAPEAAVLRLRERRANSGRATGRPLFSA